MINKLKKIRKQQSLTIEFVSDLLGLSCEEYRRIEKSNKISKQETEKLTRLYGISEKDIFESNDVLDISSIGIDVASQDIEGISKLLTLRNRYS